MLVRDCSFKWLDDDPEFGSCFVIACLLADLYRGHFAWYIENFCLSQILVTVPLVVSV